MVLDKDTRGWIMTALSGIACCLGASIICVDLLVRMFSGKWKFRIQDSNAFLSSSLSLSFGIMLFSSLYSMLPSAKTSLQRGGLSPKAAAWTLVVCFLAGVIGIQVVSRVLHHYMPSHVVDCDHNHDDEEAAKAQEPELDNKDHPNNPPMHRNGSQRWRGRPTPLRERSDPFNAMRESWSEGLEDPQLQRRPSLHSRLTSGMAQLISSSKLCDADGPCHGYSDPCGQDCFKIVQARGGLRLPASAISRPGGMQRSVTAPRVDLLSGERQPLLQNVDEEAPLSLQRSGPPAPTHQSEGPESRTISTLDGDVESPQLHKAHSGGSASTNPRLDGAPAPSHHHHIPANAFLSIGLQTSIAIALHKLPEGFITYATNHANPKLGFAVFLALFIHNITEGFAMALPLYLAINSRWKAIFWSSLLGGASQPLGACVAALWFRLAGNRNAEPGEGVYGGMFAVTAGIMASVALQLFSESLDLTHNRNLCMAFAFVGMGILGASSALTA